MPIRHHPRSELLVTYAAGTLGEGASLLVASHLTLCPACRAHVAGPEAVGATVLEALPATGVSDARTASLMAQLDTADTSVPATPAPTPSATGLPQPLRSYLGDDDLDRLPWRKQFQMNYIDLNTAGDA